MIKVFFIPLLLAHTVTHALAKCTPEAYCKPNCRLYSVIGWAKK